MQSKQAPSWRVLVDFDGSIAPDDPTDRLLERFADPAWRQIEAAWQDGQISSRECMTRQVALLRATPDELDSEIRTVRIDPDFPAFLRFCRRHDAEVKVVSDGFDLVISEALRNAQLSVPFYANKLEWQGDDRWRLVFPHVRADCHVDSANCKCSHMQGAPLRPQVIVGDGRSDFCMSTRADYVIAKGALVDYCRARGKAFASFANFRDVTARLAEWCAKTKRPSRTVPPIVGSPFPTVP